MIKTANREAARTDTPPVDWTPYFAPGTDVMALPRWGAPRLFISAAHPRQRWQQSAFYPAFRPRARAFRLALRAWAALGLAPTREAPVHAWTLGRFVGEALPPVASVTVRPGWPGPEQKITVQCRGEEGCVTGYLKYAEQPAARARLRQERRVLERLPKALGPPVLKYGPWHKGAALLTAPLQGRALPTALPPPPDVAAFVRRLVVGRERLPLQEHPWAARAKRPPGLASALGALAGRAWPVALQHGDLTPWNLCRDARGSLHAFDWEHGTTQGFPYLDLAHYVLQVAHLVKGWPPDRALACAAQHVARGAGRAFTPQEAHALVRLAAYDAYRMALEDGHSAETPIQQFRRTIWEDPS